MVILSSREGGGGGGGVSAVIFIGIKGDQKKREFQVAVGWPY